MLYVPHCLYLHLFQIKHIPLEDLGWPAAEGPASVGTRWEQVCLVLRRPGPRRTVGWGTWYSGGRDLMQTSSAPATFSDGDWSAAGEGRSRGVVGRGRPAADKGRGRGGRPPNGSMRRPVQRRTNETNTGAGRRRGKWQREQGEMCGCFSCGWCVKTRVSISVWVKIFVGTGWKRCATG